MSKKKLEVVELNKKEEQIVLEEKQSPLVSFWLRHKGIIYLTALIVSLTVFIVSFFITVNNLYNSDEPYIKETSIDTDLTEYNANINSGVPITEQTATNSFLQHKIFPPYGEVLVVKKLETEDFIVRYFSDKTAIKINKKSNLITRINSLENGEYGINEFGITNSKATILDVTIKETKTFPWGVVTYYSDGSAEVSYSKMNLFVRNSNDIYENYISNNKVSYLKEAKIEGDYKLNYYYDGTIEIIKNNKSYLIRNANDIQIKNNNITFKNNNQSEIINTKVLDDGNVIDYYSDGGAIIRNGTRTLSVRKSNSIIIKDNKIYEIVDNIYVTISKTSQDGKIEYYTNGGAVVTYNNKKLYIPENSDIKYQNNQIHNIEHKKEKLTEERVLNKEHIQVFEETAVIKTDEYIAIVPKDNVIYDSDGAIKEILVNVIEDNQKEFTITNNTNEKLKYRVVIEKSERTNLDVEYIRYQLTAGQTYVSPTRLDSKIWTNDNVSNSLNISGTNYILVENTIEPHSSENIKLMLWTDYETIPNAMQNKYFYGTIRVYAWQEIE